MLFRSDCVPSELTVSACATDGIVEAADASEDEFGEERLIAVMQANESASAAALRDAILQEVTRFCRGEFADDATLLTVVAD